MTSPLLSRLRKWSGSDISAEDFGEWLNASHARLRDDWKVSESALDLFVGLLQKQPATCGTRLIGAGFVRACVTLAKTGHTAAVKAKTLKVLEGFQD
ncbi:hypothetical protein [Methylocaldum szegediense]|uniref:hypothetical protein n=1 Tax=Methylocaldum szegediense TaxID=73780 RepID=UPI000566A6FF|nr:hypothetical protein [Methylocaldum szegediense]